MSKKAKKEVLLFTDQPFAALGHEICSCADHTIHLMKQGVLFSRFKNAETCVKVESNVSGKTVILLKSFLASSNNKLVHDPNNAYMELFLANNSLKHAGARRVINVIPYIPYLRQDRVKFSGEPVSSKLFADMTYRSGADMVITVDMHSVWNVKQYRRLKHLDPTQLFSGYLKKIMNSLKLQESSIIIAPDQGAAGRAARMVRATDLPCLVCRKERNKQSNITSLVCPKIPPTKSHAIIYDDMIDTGGTLFKAINALRQKGINRFTICCTHAILSGNAEAELKKRKLRLITTDSLPLKRKGIVMLSLGPMLARALDDVI